MSYQEESLRPEEFAEAAAAAVADVLGREPREVAAVLAASGLLGVCAPQERGGLGLSLEFGVPICEAAGRLQLHFPLMEQMLLARAFADSEIADALVAGDKIGVIAWQGSVSEKSATHAAFADVCDWILVADQDGASLLEAQSVSVQANGAMDPDYPHYDITIDAPTIKARLSSQAWRALMNDAHVLYTGFINGLAEQALARAAEYTATRVQFGRPLSAKQVVRHTLARMRLLHESSTAALQRALRNNEFSHVRSAETAFSGAISNTVFIIEKAIHLHGGMGFTWELPLHYALRDVRKIEAAFNHGHQLEKLGAQFIAAA